MKVSWDDYSQYMENWKMFQTTNQISTSYSLRMCITISVGLPRSAVGKIFTILLGEIIWNPILDRSVTMCLCVCPFNRPF